MNVYQKYKPAWQQLMIFIALTIGLFFSISLIAVFIIKNIYDLSFAELSALDLSNPTVLAAAKPMQAVTAIALFLVPSLVFAYLSDKHPMKYVGFRPAVPGQFYLIAIFVILACFPLVAWLGELNQHMHLPKAMEGTEKMIRDAEARSTDFLKKFLDMKSPGDLATMLFILALLPAVAEELFFRGILQRIFIQMTRRPWIGIVITAVLFSALHGQFLGFIPRAVLGVVLGALYWYSGSIYPCIIAHFFNNAAQIVLVYYRPQFVESEPNFAAGIIAGSTILVIALLWWMQRISQTNYAEIYDTDDFHIGPRDQYTA